MNIQQLLELAVVRNASDIHLVAGYPPTLRVHGELVPVVGTESLTDSEISGLILSILTPVQKSVFENNFELDFAIPFQNKARFRVNVFKEQGHLGVSLRLIPLFIPAFERSKGGSAEKIGKAHV